MSITQMQDNNTNVSLNVGNTGQSSSSGSGVSGASSDIYSMSQRELVQGVISGKYGVDNARKQALGSRYKEIQTLVNQIYAGKLDMSSISNERPTNYSNTGGIYSKSQRELVEGVMSGRYGNGDARKQALGNRYKEIQPLVNKVVKGQLSIDAVSNVKPGGNSNSSSSSSSAPRPSNGPGNAFSSDNGGPVEVVADYSEQSGSVQSKSQRELVEDVLSGKYGAGDARKKALGDRYAEIQPLVNKVVKGQLSINAVSNERPGGQATEQTTEKKHISMRDIWSNEIC